MAAARPLPVHLRDPLHAVAHALSDLNVIGPGAMHQVCRELQRQFFDPPDLSGIQGHIEVSLSWLLGPDRRGLLGSGAAPAAPRAAGAAWSRPRRLHRVLAPPQIGAHLTRSTHGDVPAAVSWLAFVSIELQWSKARYAPGIVGLIMNGAGPARVPDRVVAEIRSREVGGLVKSPKPVRFGAAIISGSRTVPSLAAWRSSPT